MKWLETPFLALGSAVWILGLGGEKSIYTQVEWHDLGSHPAAENKQHACSPHPT